jgi:hypothetical protein
MRVAFHLTFKEQYIASLALTYRVPLSLIISLLIPMVGLFYLYSSLASGSFDLFQVPLLLLMIGFTPMTVLLTVWLSRRRNRTIAGEHVYEINEDGLKISGKVFETKISWEALAKVTETNRFFFFFISTSRAHFLPKRVIDNAEGLAELRSLVASKTGREKN